MRNEKFLDQNARILINRCTTLTARHYAAPNFTSHFSFFILLPPALPFRGLGFFVAPPPYPSLFDD